MDVPNLDCMTTDPDELFRWGIAREKNPRRYAREMFGERDGSVNATRNLGRYATNKATAMHCRLEGNIDGAISYEHTCEETYNRLPDWARW